MTTPGIQLAIDNELALLTTAVRGNQSKVAALLDPEFKKSALPASCGHVSP